MDKAIKTVYAAPQGAYRTRYLKNIEVTPDRARVLSRLGFSSGRTEMDAAQNELLEECLNTGKAVCRLAGAYRYIKVLKGEITEDSEQVTQKKQTTHEEQTAHKGQVFNAEHSEEGSLELENGIRLYSADLVDFLGGCPEILFMAATAGSEIIELINNELMHGNKAKAVILDSVASQTADAALDVITDMLNRVLALKGEKLTRRRYSPGYGDLDLSYQKTIYELLDLEKIGISINKMYMLQPEKSVAAIAGVLRAR
ncbi:MAG: vitamin B12 dependent-methionine synthase activation domain-containing protein [Eubacteriales bacterium]|nr:vitamin B12 dependent-methionine synthase activation domain-containing protein [Eubacteriales bacterium]